MSDQERKVYSFKSVGETVSAREDRFKNIVDEEPIGIKTPLRLSQDQHRLFEMYTDIGKQIKDNFRNMLATNHGERLMLHDFGANLLPLAFELGDEAIDTEALRRINQTTQKYMPYLSLETFEQFSEPSESDGVAKVGIRVGYSVPKASLFEQTVEAIIFAIG